VNVGGRPLNSWPSFIPVTFELTILFASLTAVFGLLACAACLCRIILCFTCRGSTGPRAIASSCASKAGDPRFERTATTQFLAGLNPREVSEVPQ